MPGKKKKQLVRRRTPLIVQMDWEGFRERMLRYAQLPSDRRSDLLFRGLGNSSWPLETTLDRRRQFGSDQEREDIVKRLLAEFRFELIRLAEDDRVIPEGDALELLARHHGLPSPLLDLTQSPWTAAFFAYQDVVDSVDHVAVWRLDRSRVSCFGEEVDLIDDVELLRFNRRALMQRGVFIRVNTIRHGLERLIAPALIQYELKASDRPIALAELDEMGINATRLYADVAGAAATAWTRMTLGETS